MRMNKPTVSAPIFTKKKRSREALVTDPNGMQCTSEGQGLPSQLKKPSLEHSMHDMMKQSNTSSATMTSRFPKPQGTSYPAKQRYQITNQRPQVAHGKPLGISQCTNAYQSVRPPANQQACQLQRKATPCKPGKKINCHQQMEDNQPSARTKIPNKQVYKQQPSWAMEKPMVQKAKPTTQNSDKSLRVFTVTVGKMKQWGNSDTGVPAVFEIYGNIDSAVVKSDTQHAKEFMLRSDGQAVKCVFHEMDRDLLKLSRGQYVRCVGKLTQGKLQCVSVRPATDLERRSANAQIYAAEKAMSAFAGQLREF